ncbi:MAG: hypothetical protein AUJ55_10180 [Proteobacteria bacterium CG1_02_64_396]|nr:MAG: hypothetical protein AUJ55_10180 [Proteobacteria bacterium CG1_02_64_396]
MLRIAGRDCEYVLTAERDLPKEEQTVFVLRELNAVERKALDYDQPGSPFRLKKEQLEGGAKGEMVLVYDIPQSDDPATTRRNNEALAAHRKAYAGYLVEVFRRGVREVRNLTDGQGKAITLSGPEAAEAIREPEVFEEIFRALTEHNTLSETDRKN